MSEIHLFPFEKVESGSKVIIYGAGDVGKEYIEQIRCTKWCKVLSVVDSNYEAANTPCFRVEKPESIKNQRDYDKIIIAIDSKTTRQGVKQYLISLQVEADKILEGGGRRILENGALKRQLDLSKGMNNIYEGIKLLNVAMHICGDLGDYVVALRFYQELTKLAPNSLIDIYGKPIFANPVYKGQHNCGEIISGRLEAIDYTKYDIVFDISHVVDVKKVEYYKVKSIYPELAKKIKQVIDTSDNYFVDVPSQAYKDAIFIRRGLYKGYNRYSALSNDGIFDINDKKVKLILKEEFYSSFKELGLNKYMTLNRGAADIFGTGKMQMKVWPKECYEGFIQLFKEKYPDIIIVQLGDRSAQKLNGADKYILGEDFELVKHVLNNSILHIDCEGGLTHMATQLGTKCAVLFGPTPVEYYGYEQNINIVSQKCNSCMGLILDWYVKCIKGNEKPECMYSISPQIVLEKISDHMQKYREP